MISKWVPWSYFSKPWKLYTYKQSWGRKCRPYKSYLEMHDVPYQYHPQIAVSLWHTQLNLVVLPFGFNVLSLTHTFTYRVLYSWTWYSHHLDSVSDSLFQVPFTDPCANESGIPTIWIQCPTHYLKYHLPSPVPLNLVYLPIGFSARLLSFTDEFEIDPVMVIYSQFITI